MTFAITRAVPPSIGRCELTYLAREPIDWERANAQHALYEDMLRALGCTVQRLATLPDHPDSVFVEDTAVVLDEIAVITRPGAESRRGEIDSVAEALRPHRRLHVIDSPGTLDGGDVLRIGRELFVGLSTRTNMDGARQLADATVSLGYQVHTVAVRNCLHLKSAASALPDGRILIDPEQVDASTFPQATCIEIAPAEPAGANVLCVNGSVVCPAAAPRTIARLRAEGYAVRDCDASELARAEGALTCCCLLVSD